MPADKIAVSPLRPLLSSIMLAWILGLIVNAAPHGELLAADLPQVSSHEIFDSLISREKLGSTGLGKGVAIPHGRITGLQQPVCAFIRLEDAIEFDATDGQPGLFSESAPGTWHRTCGADAAQRVWDR